MAATVERTDASKVDYVVDWEIPTGGELESRPRTCLPPYVFDGPGDAHLIGQPCGLLQSDDTDRDFPLVVLACGCRARVPRSTLSQNAGHTARSERVASTDHAQSKTSSRH